MGLTVEEFLRTFPAVAGNRRWQRKGKEIRLELEEGTVTIHLQPMPPRRLASLEVPVTRVELHLEEVPPERASAFLSRFQRCYQRGGG